MGLAKDIARDFVIERLDMYPEYGDLVEFIEDNDYEGNVEEVYNLVTDMWDRIFDRIDLAIDEDK